MPHISQIKDSKYLTKEDCGRGILVTIKGWSQANVAKQGEPEETKYILLFHEQEKGMVLNSTNAQLIAKICGSEEIDHWTGRQIVLFNDPNISFAGRITGGIRARAPKQSYQQQQRPPAQPPQQHQQPLPPPPQQGYQPSPYPTGTNAPYQQPMRQPAPAPQQTAGYSPEDMAGAPPEDEDVPF